MEVIFGSVMVFLLASVVIVPIAKRLRLGSVLGYLLAGLERLMQAEAASSVVAPAQDAR